MFGASNELTGVLGLPDSSEVLVGVGFGANGSEFLGSLQVVSGNVSGPVRSNGSLPSPLFTNRDYLAAYGTGFVWGLGLGFDPTSGGTVRFRGRKLVECESEMASPLTYAWDVAGATASLGGGNYELSVDVTRLETPSEPGEHRWWLVFETDVGEIIPLLDGEVQWMCG